MKHILTGIALAALGLTLPARAAEYTILVYETPAELALRTSQTADGQAYWAAWAKFADELAQSGAIRGGAPLDLPAQGRVLVGQTMTAGSLSANGLHLGGYFKVETASLDAAAALAAKAPSLSRGGAAEVRPTFPAPGMAR